MTHIHHRGPRAAVRIVRKAQTFQLRQTDRRVIMQSHKHEGEHLERNTTDRKMPSKDADKHRAGREDETPEERRDANRDPITNAPGSHPVGTGIGAAGGAAVGAGIGAIGGPVGSIAGGVIGAVAGGLAGKGVAESIDPTHEHKYWQENFRDRDYVDVDADYDDYGPAYQYGWESYCTIAKTGKASDFNAVEPELGRRWNENRSSSGLSWDEAKPATRDAWERSRREYGHEVPGSVQHRVQ
jgi:hypothetical protein